MELKTRHFRQGISVRFKRSVCQTRVFSMELLTHMIAFSSPCPEGASEGVGRNQRCTGLVCFLFSFLSRRRRSSSFIAENRPSFRSQGSCLRNEKMRDE